MDEPKKCRWTGRNGKEHECEHEATHDDGTHCIFHASKKLDNEFDNSLIRLVQKWKQEDKEKWDFSGFVFQFQDSYDSDDHPFDRALRKPDTNITVIKKPVIFNDATFRSNAWLHDIEFLENVSFERTKFERSVLFSSSIFHQSVDFKTAYFPIYPYHIKDEVNNISFSNTRFYQNGEFSNLSFGARVDFSRSTFCGKASFGGASFIKDADFNRMILRQSVDFRKAQFHGNANFGGVLFCEDVYFTSTKFNGFVSFYAARINEYADLHSTQFGGDAWFQQMSFRGVANFASAGFGREADFTCASFSRLGNFNKCTIKGRVRWLWPGDGKKRDEAGNKIERGILRFTNLQFDEGAVLDLRRNALQDDCKLEIHDCNMKHILLEGTDCTQIGFYNNNWPSIGDGFAKRMWTPISLFLFVLSLILPCIVYPFRKFEGLIIHRDTVGDECHNSRLKRISSRTWKKRSTLENDDPRKHQPPWRLIRRTYQQLARRFREDLDHPRANEFDRGAFEMRRLEMKVEGGALGWSTYIGLSIYKYLSHYSGSLGLPMFWWGLLIIICAFLFSLLSGFEFTGELTRAEIGYMWKMLALSFKSAISLMRTEIERYIVNPDWRIVTLAATQKLLSGVLLTLFIFAIRRRFKH